MTTQTQRRPRIALMVALTSVILAFSGSGPLSGVATASPSPGATPVVKTENGAVRGVTVVAGAYAFRGLPYAAPPTGRLRWREPQPASKWNGVRDASGFAPSCPQLPGLFAPPGDTNEDCLYLNVYAPARVDRGGSNRPVLVWIHGGGLASDGARNYEPAALAAEGTVVVTINYRLGVLGFLSHPALASRPGGPSGNYGLMDQQAALRWVQRNIREFGGDPGNVTIAGESAGGLSVLMHLVSHGSRGLFQKAIVQSGTFALTQLPLTSAEAFGQQVAAQAGCPSQTAQCLRGLPVDTLLSRFPTAAIPGVVDGKVLEESVGSALAAGRFARVPIINGVNHDEERIFVVGLGLAVSGGTFVQVNGPVTDATYQQVIKSTLGVSDARVAAIAVEYPTSAYDSPQYALSALLADANFSCTALQVDKWTSTRVPTFAYQFDDDSAPPRYADLGVATHTSELPYLLDLPNAPIQTALDADQQQLATTMRAAWARFAARGNPSTNAVPWPSFGNSGRVLSLVPPQPHVDTTFAARHHCAFWAAA